MGIDTFIESKLTDIAVYWGNPQDDGQGGKTFDPPVEISCRWKDIQQIMGLLGDDDKGERLISRATVIVSMDLDYNGMLCHTTLDALYDSAESSGAEIDPMTLENAYLIKRLQKVPSLNNKNICYRKVFLTPWIG